MKRFITIILSLAMVLSLGIGALAVDLREVSSSDPYTPQLVEVKVDIDGTERVYYEYVAKQYQTATPVIYIFVPSGEDIQDFLVSSGWKATADASGITLIFPAYVGDGWDTENGDLAYWKKVSGVVPQNTRNHNTRVYLAGYGDGAIMAQVALLERPQVFGGAAFVDCADMDKALLEKYGNAFSYGWVTYQGKLSYDIPTYAKNVEQNVLFIQRKGTDLSNSIEFWKDAASASKSTKTLTDGSIEYVGTENPEAGVTIKTVAAEEESGKVWSDAIWQFMDQTRRYRNAPDSVLGAASDYRDNPNAKLLTMNINGRIREWVEVLPSDYDASKSYPVVLALHGSNNDGPQMYELTRLWEVAEARDFIALFPTGSRTESAYDLWDYKFETADSNGREDIEFLEALLNKYKTEYAVDASRIYVTGFSNGGSMTNALAMRHPEWFAAAMPYSGAVPKEYYPEITDDTLNIPVWMNKGTLETTSQSIGSYGPDQVAYWYERNQVDSDDYSEKTEGVFVTKTYNAAVPFIWTDRIDGAHAIFSENYWEIYNDFFAHCQRGAEGESIWNEYNVSVTSAVGGVKSFANAKLIDGVVYLPLREALESIGATVTWNAADQSIDLSRGGAKAHMAIGSDKITSGSNVFTAEAKVILTAEGKTYVPAEAMYEALSLKAELTAQPLESTLKITK